MGRWLVATRVERRHQSTRGTVRSVLTARRRTAGGRRRASGPLPALDRRWHRLDDRAGRWWCWRSWSCGAAFRDNDAVDVEPVDYLAVVGPAQEAGLQVVVPAVPARRLDGHQRRLRPRRPAGLGRRHAHRATASSSAFAQEDDDLDSLLDTYVDEDAAEGEHRHRRRGASSPSGRSGRTPAVTTRTPPSIGDYEVLVFGTAPTDDARSPLSGSLHRRAAEPTAGRAVRPRHGRS